MDSTGEGAIETSLNADLRAQRGNAAANRREPARTPKPAYSGCCLLADVTRAHKESTRKDPM